MLKSHRALVYSIVFGVVALFTSAMPLQSQLSYVEYNIDWSPSGAFLSVVDDGGLTIYDADQQPLTALQLADQDIIFSDWSPSGAQLAVAATRPGQVLVYNWLAESASFVLETTLTGNSNYRAVRGVAWSPNGMYLATLGEELYANSSFVSEIQVWDTSNWQLIMTSADQFAEGFNRLDWSPDSSTVFSVGIRLCRSELSECQRLVNVVFAVNALSGELYWFDRVLGVVQDLAVSRNGTLVVSSDGSLYLYNTTPLERISVLEGVPHTAITWSPDSRHITALLFSHVYLLDPTSGAVFTSLPLSPYEYADMEWNALGELAVITRGGEFTITDLSGTVGLSTTPTSTTPTSTPTATLPTLPDDGN